MPKVVKVDWEKVDPILLELWADYGYRITHAAVIERTGLDLTDWQLRHRATKYGLKITQEAVNTARNKARSQNRKPKQVMVDAAVTEHFRDGGWISVNKITGVDRTYIIRRATALGILMTKNTEEMMHDIDLEMKAKTKAKVKKQRESEQWPMISNLEKLALYGR